MIEFQDVSFSYDSTERESGVFHLNLSIPTGQVVLFCGESGCGKTTLTRLVNKLIPEYFSGKLISERIEAIMKFKKTSILACAFALVLVVGATTAFATSSGAWQEFDLDDLNLTEGHTGTETDNMKIVDSEGIPDQVKDLDQFNLTEGQVGTQSNGMKMIDPSDTRGQILDTDDLDLVEGNVGTENSSMKMFEYTPEEWNDIQQKIDNGEIVWQH